MRNARLQSWIRPVAFAAGLLALSLAGEASVAAEPYRLLSPSGDASHPAILLVPGCSGFTSFNGVNLYDERADELLSAGYAVVFVDYVGARGLRNCAHVSHAEVGADIIRAAEWISKQPGIHQARIAALGWSYGAGGILAALVAMAPGPPLFTKAVMYYPDCRGAKPWSVAGVSALMFMGGMDEVALPILCDAVVKGAPPHSLRTILYPKARHAFDLRSLPERAQYLFGTLGYNAEAAEGSWSATLDLLK